MKKLLLLNITFWVIAIFFENAGYVPTWQPDYWPAAIINMLLYAALFYGTGAIAYNLSVNTPLTAGAGHWLRRWQLWVLVAMPFAYTAAAGLNDTYVINVETGSNLFMYAVHRLKTCMIYFLPPLMWGAWIVYRGLIIKAQDITNNIAEQEKAQLREDVHQTQVTRKRFQHLKDKVREQLNQLENY